MSLFRASKRKKIFWWRPTSNFLFGAVSDCFLICHIASRSYGQFVLVSSYLYKYYIPCLRSPHTDTKKAFQLSITAFKSTLNHICEGCVCIYYVSFCSSVTNIKTKIIVNRAQYILSVTLVLHAKAKKYHLLFANCWQDYLFFYHLYYWF